jgi:hypothetical protein
VRVAEVIRELQRRELPTDGPEFVDAVARASSIALGTHLEAKLTMLQAAILHAALPDRPSDIVTMRFLRFVEELDPEHFVVLAYLRDPEGHFDRNGIEKPNIYAGSPGSIMDAAQIPIDGGHVPMIVGDLAQRGLGDATLNTMMTGNGAWAPRTTPLGHQLLDFVTYIGPPEGPAAP